MALNRVKHVDLSGLSPDPFEIAEDHVIFHHIKAKYFNRVLENSAIAMMLLDRNKHVEVDLFKEWFSSCDMSWENCMKMLMNVTYISCWYYSDHLTKAMVDEFAGEEGVVISSTVRQWKNCLEENNRKIGSNSSPYEFGLVAYLPKARIPMIVAYHTSEWMDTTRPLFLKDNWYSYQRELRTIYQDNVPLGSPMENPVKMHLVSVDLSELANEIYLPIDENSACMIENLCTKFGYVLKRNGESTIPTHNPYRISRTM